MYNGENILSGGLAILFSLTTQPTAERLLNANQLQLIIDNLISKEVFWDFGVPKGQAEFLLYGSAYSFSPVRGLVVSAMVGEVSKLLMVLGERVWGDFTISEPNPFRVLPLNYNYAFGGADFSLNPLGKGYSTLNQSGRPLPNIESLEQLLVSRSDTPNPAGFEPYPSDWPQRSQYFEADTPFNYESELIPEGALLEHFNTAPIDQRIKGFFRGDERIELKNMHPTKSTVSSTLPGIRLRLFVVQQNGEGSNDFREIVVQNETLSLLPNLELGILLFRSICPIANLQATDVECMYCVLEELDDEPQSVEYYYQHFMALLAPTSTLDQPVPIDIADEEQMIAELFAKLQQLNDGSSLPANPQIQALLLQLTSVLKQFKLTEKDAREYIANRKKDGLSSALSNSEIMEYLKDVWINDAELEARLKKFLAGMSEIKQQLG